MRSALNWTEAGCSSASAEEDGRGQAGGMPCAVTARPSGASQHKAPKCRARKRAEPGARMRGVLPDRTDARPCCFGLATSD
eukprot:2684163-Alexandrium_andersonii.AAC.1